VQDAEADAETRAVKTVLGESGALCDNRDVTVGRELAHALPDKNTDIEPRLTDEEAAGDSVGDTSGVDVELRRALGDAVPAGLRLGANEDNPVGDADERDEALVVIVVDRVRETAADEDGCVVLVPAAVSVVVSRGVADDVDVRAITEPLDDTESETKRVCLDDCVAIGEIDTSTGVADEQLLTLGDEVIVEVRAADRDDVTDAVTVAKSGLEIDGIDEVVAGSMDSETVELAL
jgi:hypothetical protein